MNREYALILAWPETKCKQAGAWYDGLMEALNFSNGGYYKVGHAAIVLINRFGTPYYFDFGRYHAPHGHGRVRDAQTDTDLELKTIIQYVDTTPVNIDELIDELQNKKACHGDGKLECSLVSINFCKAFKKAKEMQNRVFIPYGPFVRKGTNCSRFVKSVANNGIKSFRQKLILNLPPMLTPTPMWNVFAGEKIRNYEEDKNIIQEEEIIVA